MSSLAAEFQDILDLYARLKADLTRIDDAGKTEGDPQEFIQSILDHKSCLMEIRQLNERFTQLYGAWKDGEKNLSTSGNDDDIQTVVNNIEEQMRQIEKLCDIGIRKVEELRKQLSDELANIGKGSRYLKMISPVQENHPKFIDSAC